MRLSGAILVLAASSVLAASNVDSRRQAIDEIFGEYDQPGRPGFAVGVYERGKPDLLSYYGVADLGCGDPIGPETQFNAGSVSKQFTAFAIALLARDGTVDLDASVRDYLPWVPEIATAISVRQLVHHTSGLRDEVRMLAMAGKGTRTQGQIIKLVARQQGLNFKSGTEFWYGNTGYVLLAELVEVITGQTFREFTSERMFEPLGMTNTHFLDDVSEIVPQMAEAYAAAKGGGWKKFYHDVDVLGSTGLVTTAEDLLKWVRNFDDPVVGGQEVIDTVTARGHLDDGTPVAYGFGLELTRLAGRAAISHGGSHWGFKTNMAYFPNEGVGVVILTNAGIASGEAMVEEIARHLLPKVRRMVPASSAAVPDAKLLADLSGQYLPPHGKQVIFERDGAKLFWTTRGAEPRPVLFRADGTFGIEQRWGPRYTEFHRAVRDETGRVLGFDEQGKGWDGRQASYVRLDESEVTAAKPGAFVGEYYSPELDVTYTITSSEGKLVAESFHIDLPMTFDAVATDRFDSDQGPIDTIIFERNADGSVTGFRADAFRVHGVLFRKRKGH